MARKKIVAGNWKMNTTLKEAIALTDEILSSSELCADVQKILFPPFPFLTAVSEKTAARPDFFTGAQNCAAFSSGAYTGEVSVAMIASCGASHVLIGHSERRQYFSENASDLRIKTELALSQKLIPVFCIGEKMEERQAGNHFEIVKKQMHDSLFHLDENAFGSVIIAYEPVWAIGTGLTASPDQAQEMHHYIRTCIAERYGKTLSDSVSVLYGGSCNAQNAKGLFSCPDIDGGLIGGASLKATDFTQIIKSF